MRLETLNSNAARSTRRRYHLGELRTSRSRSYSKPGHVGTRVRVRTLAPGRRRLRVRVRVGLKPRTRGARAQQPARASLSALSASGSPGSAAHPHARARSRYLGLGIIPGRRSAYPRGNLARWQVQLPSLSLESAESDVELGPEFTTRARARRTRRILATASSLHWHQGSGVVRRLVQTEQAQGPRLSALFLNCELSNSG